MQTGGLGSVIGGAGVDPKLLFVTKKRNAANRR